MTLDDRVCECGAWYEEHPTTYGCATPRYSAVNTREGLAESADNLRTAALDKPRKLNPDPLADRIAALPDEVLDAENAYRAEGHGVDSYSMGLAHVCAKHDLPPSYAAKLDELIYRGASR